MSKTFNDTSKPLAPGPIGLVGGDLWVADNGLPVIVADKQTLVAFAGKKIATRVFSSPVSRNWIRRQVNAFADTIKPARRKKAA